MAHLTPVALMAPSGSLQPIEPIEPQSATPQPIASAEPIQIKLGREVSGVLAPGEALTYRLRASTPGLLQLDFTEDGAATDFSFHIRTADGADLPIDSVEHIECAALLPAAGEYVVTLTAPRGDAAQPFHFKPSLVNEKYTSYDAPGNETVPTADALQLGRPIVGMVRDSFADVYKLATGTGGLLHLSFAHPEGAGSTGAPVLMTLYDFEGREATHHVFYGTELRTIPVPGGTYYAKLSNLPHHDQTPGLYTIIATVTGRQDAQLFAGTRADDTLYVDEGNDTVYGNGGWDTLVFSGLRADYRLTFSPAAIVASSQHEDTDTLIGIERLQFSDTVIDLGSDTQAAQLYRLYQIAFGRPADADGLGFWVHAMEQGLALQGVAHEFTISEEFKAVHGDQTPPEQLLDDLYRLGLGRAPDQPGLSFWTDALDAGLAIGDLLLGFSESAENQAKLIGAISHGVEYNPFAG